MNSKRFREILLVAALLAVPAMVLRASLRAPSDLNWLDRIVLRGSAPVQAAVATGTGALGDAWRHYVYLVDVDGKNRGLREDNARLLGELAAARLELQRTTAREDLLGLRRRVPSETLAARVVGVDTSPYFRVLRVKLDRGDGEVRPGMPVLVPSGVVGSVRRVYGAWSDVLLAIDPESSIDVVAPRTGAQGTLRGVAGEYKYRMRLLRTEELREGDAVLTSGNDGVYPRDVPIGTVTRVSTPDAGLWREAEVAPSVDFPRLREVLVVLAPPPPDPEAPAGAKRVAPPTAGSAPPDERAGPTVSPGRALTFLAAAWLGLIALAAFQLALPSVAARVPGPDVLLIVVLFLGLSGRGGLASTCALALLCGWLGDLFAGSPKGLHMVVYASTAVAARAASSRLMVRGAFLTALVGWFFALGAGALMVALRTSLHPQLGWSGLRTASLQAVVTALCAPLLFRVLARLDRRYGRDQRASRALVGGVGHPAARATAAHFARLVGEVDGRGPR